jgi:hypothetical protein
VYQEEIFKGSDPWIRKHGTICSSKQKAQDAVWNSFMQVAIGHFFVLLNLMAASQRDGHDQLADTQ